MNELRLILRAARVSLIALGLALAACLSLLMVLRSAHEQARIGLLNEQLDLAKAQTRLRERQADLSLLQADIQQFHQLLGQGLLGQPDRTGWVEQLLDSHHRRGLPAGLSYTLHSPHPAASPAASAPGLLPETGPGEALFHELEFKLQGVHEEELLGLLQDFESRASGRFRIDFCQLSQRTPRGLTAHCRLRFVTLPWSPGIRSASSAPNVTVPMHPPATTVQLQTLFYSPSERAAVVRERAGDVPGGQEQRLRVSGIVKREHGHSTAWVNQQVVSEDPSEPAMRGSAITDSTVTVDGERLRVGETLNLRTRQRTGIVDATALSVKGGGK